MIAILLILCVCWCLFRLWNNNNLLRQPPSYPGRLPISGHAFKLLSLLSKRELWEFYKNISDFSLCHDGVACFDIGPKRLYFITDPEDCLIVSNTCLSKPYIYNFLEPWLKASIFYSEPLQWKPDRNICIQLMNSRNFDSINILNKCAIKMGNKLSDLVGKGKCRIDAICIMFTMETIFELVFGLESEDMSAVNSEYNAMADHIFDMVVARIMNPLLHIPFVYNSSSFKKRFIQLAKMATGSIQKRIKDRKRLLKLSGENKEENGYRPILDTFLELNKNQKRYTDEELADHVENLIFAAYDTTARSMLMALLCIGSYEHVQERIFAELQQVLGDSNRDLDKDDLSRLVYLEAAIKESIRVYPTVPMIAREASVEVKLKNYTIPKGGLYFLSIYGMHRHSVWGADAEQFRVDRWLEPSGVPENAFATFSFGKRGCIGKAFGMALMKTALAHILRRYRVKADVTKTVFDVSIFLTPTSGGEIGLELRKIEL